MAFDQTTRNRLQKFVSEARGLLSDEFTRQLQNDYGMDPDTGTISDIDNLTHLNDAQHQTAKLLLETMGHYQASSPNSDIKEILSRIVREQAFTVLNRLCALRMAEARGILIESIAKGYNSKGFQLYARVAKTSLGESGDTYRNYLFSVLDEFAIDLAVLFDRYSPMGRLFPKESVLLELLDQINDMEIENLWAEDETIGWIYQYFNSKEERKKMRDESQAPRNSRELAVRNQFFTPRYVVEFLTDNTLGRIWYEMRKGNTALKNQCRYLVRRPSEIFLEKGEKVPEQKDNDALLSQEELLKQPVYIEHRPIKDPRDILMLDPACGSMHFGLYAFDLYEKIYEEAWDLQATGQLQNADNEKFALLTETYTTREDFLRDIPRLIIENNIHGVDIDPRAVQIAGLSLWLRTQRSWKEQAIKPSDRPQIRKSNIVCAEPMPGEDEYLKDFSGKIKPKILGQLVEIIFEKMKIAGEAGSLLKIEEEIADAVDQAREEFNKELLRRKEEAGYLPGMAPKKEQRSLFDFADLPDKTQFWYTAEEKILEALRNYAEQAEAEDSSQRRLFVEDAAKGFAFIDLCRRRYDVVLMNPPFGLPPKNVSGYIKDVYPDTYVDLYACSVTRGKSFALNGSVGAITSRAFLTTKKLVRWRTNEVVVFTQILLDLGLGVMDDAFVEACAFVMFSRPFPTLMAFDKKDTITKDFLPNDLICADSYIVARSDIKSLPSAKILYSVSPRIHALLRSKDVFEPKIGTAREGLRTFNDFRFLRLKWEVSPNNISSDNIWEPLAKGGEFSRYYSDLPLLVRWFIDGRELAEENRKVNGQTAQSRQASKYYRRPGGTYSKRSAKGFSLRALPSGCIIGTKGPAVLSESKIPASYLIGWLNSRLIRSLIHIQANASEFNTGILKRLPWKYSEEVEKLSRIVLEAINSIRQIDSTNEVNSCFSTIHIYSSIDEFAQKFARIVYEAEKIVAGCQKTWDEKMDELYDVDSSPLAAIFDNKDNDAEDKVDQDDIEEDLIKANGDYLKRVSEDIVSYAIGVVMGRWDIRIACESSLVPELPDPFDPLPPCPPGMLQNAGGLPAEPKDVPDDYPIRITWSGIIVDDEGHPEDVITRVREAIEVIWKDKANNIEQEACEILGVGDLREYYAKPAKFFSDHLKRYSKSRRQAPIYWPLSTPSGSYTLWLYYHRLTDQTLYTCVNNFVGPKLKQVSDNAENLRKKSNRTSQEEKDLEKMSDLTLELKDFHDELLRIAKFWKPNLNDGVQITAAPLWKLFQLKTWQTKLKQTWKDLEKGKYDWAHLAYSIWPDRVIRASHKDRSYAIAHDLEEDLWEEIENGSNRQGNPKTKWVQKKLSEKELKQIIHEKMNE